MNWKPLWKYRYSTGVGLIIIFTVIYKFRFLFLPYYWDEASPYSIAVHDLYEHGLSLLPGAISSLVSRGHPLMFHFLAVTWMKIFGQGLLPGHSFALFISVCLIISIYLFCKTFFSERIGFIACLLFSSQPIFIAQSVFLMPEILMALWTMLAFLAFFKKKKFLFIVFGTAMLLTKEPGVIFFFALFLYEFAYFLRTKEKKTGILFKNIALVSLPVILASVYFILQKIKFGWFFYPFHLDHIFSSKNAFFDILPNASAYSFIYDGRNGLSIFIIISLLIIFIPGKIKFTKNEKTIIPAFCIFIILFILFSSANFYIPRYLMCIFPPFYIIGSILIDKVFARLKLIFLLIISGLVITSIFYYTQPKKSGDIDYSCSIITDWQMVDFCEKQNLYDKHIFAGCLLRLDLGEPVVGYRSSSEKFSHIEWVFSDKTDYCIFSADEIDNDSLAQIKKEHKLELVKRFEQKYAWCEIYKVIHY